MVWLKVWENQIINQVFISVIGLKKGSYRDKSLVCF